MVILTVVMLVASASATPPSLEAFLDTIPASEPFSQWLTESGEQYPVFDDMPSQASLPDPLLPIVDGKIEAVTTVEAWRKERARLLQVMHHWFLGTVPETPKNMQATLLSEKNTEQGREQEIELAFGPEHKARLWMKLLLPPGSGPFPVFMTQETHRSWAQIALQRGYIACIYAGADTRDDTDTFCEAWPDCDWSRLLRRGWAAGRCLDYLETVPEADTSRTALAGHSRNGKSSLMGGAVDERIAVIISSSSGVGGSMPSRYCGEHQMAEGIDHITRTFPEWFHPRWRFFAGNEHKLPFDLHQLICLTAPRPVLLSIAVNDPVEHTWAMQHSYLEAQKVFKLYGAEEHLRILWRQGGHETWPEVIEQYLDWCDLHFGRDAYVFPERFVYPWDWEAWRKNARTDFSSAEFQKPAAGDREKNDLKEVVQHFMGEASPHVPVENTDYGIMKDNQLALLSRTNVAGGLERDQIVFGSYINGDIYLPKGSLEKQKKLPAVLYLPSFSTPKGYAAAYKRGGDVFNTLAQSGFAVFCYDPIGTGRRVEEAEHFYDRFPKWSLLGKKVRDAQDALNAMVQLPYIDGNRIWVVGYESGALEAMHLAAVDERPAGYAFVCPPLPFYLDTDEAETGGVRRWAQERMLLPQLGLFIGREKEIPYDLDEIMRTIAPKPLVLLTPYYDRFASPEKVDIYYESLKRCYGSTDSPEHLVRMTPLKFNHFDESMQTLLLEALMPLVKK